MFDRSSNSRAKWFAVSGSLIAGFAGIIMAVLSLAAGEETGAGALLAASGLAFGLLANQPGPCRAAIGIQRARNRDSGTSR